MFEISENRLLKVYLLAFHRKEMIRIYEAFLSDHELPDPKSLSAAASRMLTINEKPTKSVHSSVDQLTSFKT